MSDHKTNYNQETTNDARTDSPWVDRWNNTIETLRSPIIRAVRSTAINAANHPRRYATFVPLFSIFLVILGFATNFRVDVDEDVLWTPKGSRPLEHGNWIDDESGFPENDRGFTLLIHADGDNVLSIEGVRRCFDALDTLRGTPGYDDLCGKHREGECPIVSPTEFWSSDRSAFINEVGDEEDILVDSLSAFEFSNGVPVTRNDIFGKSLPVLPDNTTHLSTADVRLTRVLSYTINVGITPNPESEAEDFEADALDRLADLRESWTKEGSSFRVEYFAERSFSDEFTRAIEDDLVLIPMVFIIMAVFCCGVFSSRNIVRSRTALGFGAVMTVLLALCAGYGLMFLAGVAFTSLSQIFPFIMFGIGLDNAFILTGSFERTDRSKTVVERVGATIDDIGPSILVTALTTFVAFVLGLQSSIPAIQGFCMYAFPCIFVNFVYQITFFMALIVLDEKRRSSHRMDCLCCCVKSSVEEGEIEATTASTKREQPFTERLMHRYCDILLQPVTKVIVILSFIGLLAVSAYSTSFLRQEFDFTTVIPSDSYIQTFFDAYQDHTEQLAFYPGVYFRDVDQSDPNVQKQMMDYVNELADTKYFESGPSNFWLVDFQKFEDEMSNNSTVGDFDSVSFFDKIELFLDDPVYFDLYDANIVRRNGQVTATRTFMPLDGSLINNNVKEEINALKSQRDVSDRQPLNDNKSDWSLFTFSGDYYIWEFYAVAVREIINTTVMGVIAVAVIAALFIPHPSGTLWVTPLICIVYIDLLGFVQAAGLNVNPTLYIGMVMSIGLVVDYLMHFVFKYFEVSGETPEERVRQVLTTLGVSITIGGASTLLGVVPLAFSTSEIFWTIFVVFIGIVVLGLAHGLILMPVIMSMIGPVPASTLRSSLEDGGSSIEDGVGKTEHVDVDDD